LKDSLTIFFFYDLIKLIINTLGGVEKVKIFDYELFTGSKGNLLNLSDMLKLVMGVVAAVIASVFGQQLLGFVEKAIPGNQTQIQPFVKRPQPMAVAPVTQSVKRI